MYKNINELVYDHLTRLAREAREAEIREIIELSRKSNGNSRGWKFNRAEIHERIRAN